MKVLSLLQPWATLVVLGAKKIETRSWNTDYRGPLLIHASKGKYIGKGSNQISCRELCYREPFNQFINGGQAYDKLPFGSIIGKVELVTTTPFDAVRGMVHQNMSCYIGGHRFDFTEQEKSFGDYGFGRYGWRLDAPEKFEDSIPAKGQQILFDFMMCKVCGCHQNDACIHPNHGNCSWHDIDLCSHCANYPGEATRYSKLKKMRGNNALH